MTPLQKVAMGLVIVLLDALFGGWDGVPDPLGWLLVLAGLPGLRPVLDPRTLTWLAVVCLLVSLVTYPPQVVARLDDNAGWALSLPQLLFGFVLCTALADHDPPLAGRFRVVRWLLVLLAVAPVVVLGGGVDVLRDPLAFVVVAVQAYLVYLLFAVSGRVPGAVGPVPDDAARAAPGGDGPR